MEVTTCNRCGKPCRPGEGNPEARLLKKSDKGYCADCGLTAYLKMTPPIDMLLRNSGPEILKLPAIREQISRILISANSDCDISEIDINRVISNWDLPVDAKGRRNKG